MDFSTDQKRVINLWDKNLLVSAAAGSGKTAVLTERIVKKICDEKASADRMLIVTFTNAAAREMRERIGEKLRKRLAQNPSDEHIRKQMSALHTAQITTIDSFCLYLLKNHFEEIGLDPSFKIAEADEIAQVSSDAFDEVVEEFFVEGNQDFLDLVEIYAPKGKFGPFSDIVKKLYNSVSSYAYPFDYLEKMLADESRDIWDMPFAKFILDYENAVLPEVKKEYVFVQTSAKDTSLLNYFTEASNKISLIDSLLAGDYNSRTRHFSTMEKVDFRKGPRAKDEDKELKVILSEKIDDCNKVMTDLRSKFHPYDESTTEQLIRDGIHSSNSLIRFLIAYMKKLEDKKMERGIIDFNDMEHLALKVLVCKEGEELKPTQTALCYRDYFDEVMIDEYQDSNDVQETILNIISKQEESRGNRFMVGDIKQSIYKFRQAKPEIFAKKSDTYSTDEKEKDVKIILSKNYRSRSEVLDAVNCVFEKCMKKEVGGVEYTSDQRLNLGRTDYIQSPSNNKAELLIFTPDSAKDATTEENRLIVTNAVEYEARVVAERIQKLLSDKTQIADRKKDDEGNDVEYLRDIRYSDIAILLRATKDKDVVYQRILKEYGIPAYVISKSGYYGAWEIKLIISLLTVIDNPRQDIPLFAVMTSFIGGFTDGEIAIARAKSKKKRLFDSLKDYIEKGKDEELKNKLKSFLEEIETFRRESVYTSATDMLMKIYRHYDYPNMIASLPGGEQRSANIRLLSETADNYEKNGKFGIHDFIKYIEVIKAKEVDMGEANILDENSNVVRIMTVHASKGLEFPVCFVAGLGTGFKKDRDQIVLDDDFGAGCKAYNLKNRTVLDSPIRNAILMKNDIEFYGEEIRVLYVAMTRAKEKLILSGNITKELGKRVSPKALTSCGCYMDMVYPIVEDNPGIFDIKCVDSSSFEIHDIIKDISLSSKRDMLEKTEGTEEFKEYTYNNPLPSNLFVKTTVSELKKAAYQESEDGEKVMFETDLRKKPRFLSDDEEQIGGSRRGSAYHRVMELMDFANVYDGDLLANLRTHRRKMVDNLFIYEEDDALVNEKKIAEFLNTDLAKRMSNAAKNNKLYLEQPFVMSVNAKEVNEEFPDTEKVLVQGVIDVYFEEDGKLILMDYKTDRVESEEELVTRYKTQLDYYAEALSRLEKKPVAEIMIYSFSLGKVITI